MTKSKMVATSATLLVLFIALVFIVQEALPQDQSLVNKLSQTYGNGQAYFRGIKTYRAQILLTEYNDGKCKGTERVLCIYNQQPLRLYFKWMHGGPYEGLQASYDINRDGPEHFLALETGIRGLIGVQSWHLDSRIIYGLYPHNFRINEYCLGFLLNHVISIHNNAIAKNTIQVQDKGYSTSLIPGLKLRVYDIKLSDDPSGGVLYSRSVVGIDERTDMPRFVESYDFNGKLQLSYKIIAFEPNATLDPSIFELKKE
ncbi:MAG: DUF1571 domain-containing protein [Candidatus Alcyoniella australis]|nr:DUF1571 domain-containing protein [Candidatus Alcyoniella australis]